VNKFAKFGIFEVLWVRNPHIWIDLCEIWHGLYGIFGFLWRTKFGDNRYRTCRHRGAKNRKIAPWVILIPAFLPVTRVKRDIAWLALGGGGDGKCFIIMCIVSRWV